MFRRICVTLGLCYYYIVHISKLHNDTLKLYQHISNKTIPSSDVLNLKIDKICLFHNIWSVSFNQRLVGQ